MFDWNKKGFNKYTGIEYDKYEYYDKIIEIQRDTLLELNKIYK